MELLRSNMKIGRQAKLKVIESLLPEPTIVPKHHPMHRPWAYLTPLRGLKEEVTKVTKRREENVAETDTVSDKHNENVPSCVPTDILTYDQIDPYDIFLGDQMEIDL